MDKSLAERHYSVHKGKPFYEGLVKYITSSPVVTMVLEGRNAVAAVRKTIGSTDSSAAEAGTIRGDLGLDIERNLVHGSDSVGRAEEEIALFFVEKELVHYLRDNSEVDPPI